MRARPAPSEAEARLRARPDIIERKGRLTLLNDRLTPYEAMIRDLRAIGEALSRAGIDHLLVRRDDDRGTIAVDAAQRAEVEAALAAAFAAEPFYARAGGEDVLVADGTVSRSGRPAVVRLFRPRVTPRGMRSYGARAGVRLEFWTFGEDEIIAPASNSLMRPRMPRVEAVEATVELHGREWPTLDGMFEPLVSDIDFEIDMVFSWVDGSSNDFQRARAKRMQAYVVGEGDDSPARYRQIDELKYALRSVRMYAPWVRRIFIVTDSPRPAWLAEHPDVTMVRSEEFFADPSVLPIFNSHAVECQLHRVEGLAEHFLYSNDDMFFGRPVRPDMFFSPGGITKFIEARTRIGLGEPHETRSGHENAARVNRALLKQRFGRVTTRHLEHAATPMRRSVAYELEREFPEAFARTAASAFRSATDISVTNSLYHYYALMTGRAVVQERARVKYVETTLAGTAAELQRILQRRDWDFFCLNDGSQPEIDDRERTRLVRDFLEAYFPLPASWEIPDAQGTATPEAARLPAG